MLKRLDRIQLALARRAHQRWRGVRYFETDDDMAYQERGQTDAVPLKTDELDDLAHDGWSVVIISTARSTPAAPFAMELRGVWLHRAEAGDAHGRLIAMFENADRAAAAGAG